MAFLDKNDPVFAKLENIAKTLDREFKASQCGILGVGDSTRVRATAHSRGLDAAGSLISVKRQLIAAARESQGVCGKLQASDSHLGLIRAQCVVYGVKYIDPASLVLFPGKDIVAHQVVLHRG